MAAPKILYLVAEGASAAGRRVDGEEARNASPAGCREAWQQEKRLQGQQILHVQEPLSFHGGAAPLVVPLQHQGAGGCLPLENPLGMPVKVQILGWGHVLAGRDTSGGLAGGSLLLFGMFSFTNAASKEVATQSLGLGCDPGSGDDQKWDLVAPG